MFWVKVEDRLPDIGDEVLVNTANGMFVAMACYYSGNFHWSEQTTGCGCCGGLYEVTHWMKLPPLPKEGEK